MSDNSKPRYRVPAGSSNASGKGFTNDSFVNFAASLGYGTSNLSSGSNYGFNPISRNRNLLEWAYRGSWLVKQVVDSVADDMTREGITIESDMAPDDIDKLHQYLNTHIVWQRLNSNIKWSRLYGGSIAVIMIDGQKPETPLRLDTIQKDQFKGLMVLDRWMVWPSLDNPVTEQGPDFGQPMFYEVVSDAKVMPHMKVHYSRCIRMEGVELPYWQKMAENGWGISVIEPLYDRLIAFDSSTQGIAQLVYRAHLRTLKIEKLRELIAFGGEGYNAVIQQLGMIRLMQSNEGLTVLDSTDEFETHSFGFGGLSDVMIQLSQQLSGASQIPLVRLFGQSPAGLNSTGESDVRNYYDAINSQQEARLRRPMALVLDVCHRSLFGKPLPEGFNFSFAPLWQLDDEQKAAIAANITTAVSKAYEENIISPVTAMKELRQSSKITGVFSNITDEDIELAEQAPPPITELEGLPPPGTQPVMPAPALGGGPVGAAAPPSRGGSRPEPKAVPGASESRESPDQKLMPPTSKSHVARQFAHVGDGLTMDSVHGISLANLPCFVGPDQDSTAVWAIEQQNPDTKEFDDFKFMLCFSDRETAMNAYKLSCERAEDRIASVKRMSINGLKSFISEDQHYVNGTAL